MQAGNDDSGWDDVFVVSPLDVIVQPLNEVVCEIIHSVEACFGEIRSFSMLLFMKLNGRMKVGTPRTEGLLGEVRYDPLCVYINRKLLEGPTADSLLTKEAFWHEGVHIGQDVAGDRWIEDPPPNVTPFGQIVWNLGNDLHQAGKAKNELEVNVWTLELLERISDLDWNERAERLREARTRYEFYLKELCDRIQSLLDKIAASQRPPLLDLFGPAQHADIAQIKAEVELLVACKVKLASRLKELLDLLAPLLGPCPF